jgi:hypothetical protein
MATVLSWGRPAKHNNDDVHRCYLAGPSFWVQTLKSNILAPSLLDPLDMLMAQKSFVPHYYSTGRMMALLLAVADSHAVKAM